jgi:hypothetical protein
MKISLSRIRHDNVKITRKGGAGLQRDDNLAGKIQREWTLLMFELGTVKILLLILSAEIMLLNIILKIL